MTTPMAQASPARAALKDVTNNGTPKYGESVLLSPAKPTSSGKWPTTDAREEKAKRLLFDKLARELSQNGALRVSDFKLAWNSFALWIKSQDAKDTPVNLSRLEDVERLAKQSFSQIREAREKVKATQLYIVAVYHLNAYSSSEVDLEARWGEGKRIAQQALSALVLQMPEFVKETAREGTQLGSFSKTTRRQLFAAVIDVSEFVFSLRPLSLNSAHPKLPEQLIGATRAMLKESCPIARTCNIGHILALTNSPPTLDAIYKGHKAPITACKFFGNGESFVSGSDDATIKLWDLRSESCIRTFTGHHGPITSVAVFGMPGELRVLTSSRDCNIKIFSLEDPVMAAEPSSLCIRTLVDHSGPVTCVAVFANGSRAVSGSEDATIKIWSLLEIEYACLQTLPGHDGGVTCLAMTTDGSRLVSAGADGHVKLFAVDTLGAALLAEMTGHEARVNCICVFSQDSKLLALSGSDDTTLRLWDLATAACTYMLDGCFGAVWACNVFSGGRTAISFSDDTCQRVWSLDSGACLHTTPSHPHREYCVDVMGNRALTGGDSGTVKILHLPATPSDAFALSPVTITPLLTALSPQPKRRQSSGCAEAPGVDVCGAVFRIADAF